MNAAIGELAGDSRLCGIVAPAHAGIVGVGGVGMETVREFDDDEPDLAEVAARHHRAHVADERIARVSVVDRADRARPRRRRHDVLRLIDGYRHRLLAQHVDACLKECLGDGVVRCVGRGHGHEVDAVRPVPLAREHLAPVAIGAVRGHAQPLR